MKNKIVWIAIIITLILVQCLYKKKDSIAKENIVKDEIRREMRLDCYVKGDKDNNYICDCFIEKSIKNNNPVSLLEDYKNNPYDVIQKMNEDYYDYCLSTAIKDKLGGKF